MIKSGKPLSKKDDPCDSADGQFTTIKAVDLMNVNIFNISYSFYRIELHTLMSDNIFTEIKYD
jgi:hypothetical protein